MVTLTCLNCQGPVDGSAPLFCSLACKQTAKAVRYARSATADGRIERPDVAEAVRIKIGLALAGGYPENDRKLSEEQRLEAFARDGGKCRSCGHPATEIDHIAGGIDGDVNHEDNLQALCTQCHREKTLSR